MHQRWIQIIVLFVAWTGLGLLLAGQNYVIYHHWNSTVPALLVVEVSLSEWQLWMIFAPLPLALARRFPITRHNWPLYLSSHLAAALLIALAKRLAEMLVEKYILHLSPYYTSFFSAQVPYNFLVCLALLVASYGFEYYRRYRSQELQAFRLETALAQAQLNSLRSQLDPHFLFNALNGISTLVRRDGLGAERMIARLSDLLRLSLDSIGAQEAPLFKEIEFLRLYLEIQQMRFPDRLRVEWNIPQDLLYLPVPCLILQPLVENAVRHAIAPRDSPGWIRLSACRKNGRLELEVGDDGPGIPAALPREGTGLTNIRSRLRLLYGADQFLKLQNKPGGGLSAQVAIPCAVAGED